MHFLGPTRSLPIRLLLEIQENTSRTMPTRVSSAPLTRRSLPKARCGSLFLAHPRQILTQSLQVGAACPGCSAFLRECIALFFRLPSLLLPCLLVGFIATFTHSLSRPGVDTLYGTGSPAGLPLRSLTDCFISTHHSLPLTITRC